MRTGLYQVYWRLSHERYDVKPKDPRFLWDFIAAFVAPEDAVLWVRIEKNSRETQIFEYKIMHKGRNYNHDEAIKEKSKNDRQRKN